VSFRPVRFRRKTRNSMKDRSGPQIAGIPLDNLHLGCWMATMLKQ